MKHLKHALALFGLAVLLGASAAMASPAMEAASEATSSDSVALNLQSFTRLAADESEGLDLVGLFAAWSEAAGLNTWPFVGLVITVR